jgi:heme/copper-type cytochrome/quinol oxidase subunit 2
MSYKQWNAMVTLASVVVIGLWVAQGALASGDWAGPVSPAAWRVLWGVIWSILFNIVAIIVVTILVSIARREEFKDERSDERDVAIRDKSYRNAYFVASVGGLLVLMSLAFGIGPAQAVYGLFAVLWAASAATEISRLAYYRLS